MVNMKSLRTIARVHLKGINQLAEEIDKLPNDLDGIYARDLLNIMAEIEEMKDKTQNRKIKTMYTSIVKIMAEKLKKKQ